MQRLVAHKVPDPGAEPDRTDPAGPARPAREGHPRLQVRNGTTTLFAALDVATGQVTDACHDRYGKAEFGDFLK